MFIIVTEVFCVIHALFYMANDQLLNDTHKTTGILVMMAVILTCYCLTVVLLLVSMIRIHKLITAFFDQWQPNKCFMALQFFIFVAPVIVCGVIVLVYLPEDSRTVTDETFEDLLLYSVYQALMSVVMIALLYVVTKYSL